MTTGDRIKQARLRAGLTQSQLAEKIGVKFSAIHKYETGMVKNLKRETIAALAEALDVKPSWLMCMDDESMDAELEQMRQDQRLLWNLIQDVPPSVVYEAAAVIQRYKEQNNDPDS